MSDTKIKICGITSAVDAAACYALGADYLGVIFAQSPRMVTPWIAREIRSAVPNGNMVGIFADADREAVAEMAWFCGLDIIQLHGNESPAYCGALSTRTLLPVVRTFRPGEAADPKVLEAYRTASFFLFDLDKRNPGKMETTRELWAEAARASREGYRIFLAGGLSPSNVREAIRRASPFCVDVCSSVERSSGIKYIEAVKRFVAEVKQ